MNEPTISMDAVPVQDLEELITGLREALSLRPPSHPDRSDSLCNLATALLSRFDRKGLLCDLEESIALHREALNLRPSPHPDRSMSLNDLAVDLFVRYEQKSEVQDLEESIILHREALDLRNPPHPDRCISLTKLGSVLVTRFMQKGTPHDLEEAIALQHEALDLQPSPHPNRSASLHNLATALWITFDQKGNFCDLEQSIALHREALTLRPPPHPDRSKSLNNLSAALFTLFRAKGDFQNFEECITLWREGLDLRPPPHPHRYTSLSNLGGALATRFLRKGSFRDLEESILFQREALALRPSPHHERSMSLNNLATSLLILFKQTNGLGDLEESINLQREALDLQLPPHPDRSMSLYNLAGALLTRFEQKGAFRDLEESITLLREGLDLNPPLHPNRLGPLNNLALTLRTRFRHKGLLHDLEESIALHREALELQPLPHPDRSMSLNNLAIALSTRFEQRRMLCDLEESIALHHDALDLRPPSHPGRSTSLYNLANAVYTRYKLNGMVGDLEQSIILHRQALSLRPPPHPGRCNSLTDLAEILTARFEREGAVQDPEESIVLCCEALDLEPDPHPDRCIALYQLANTFRLCFEQKDASQNVIFTPPLSFKRKAGALHISYNPSEDNALIEIALLLYQQASEYETGYLHRRLHFAKGWVACAEKHCPSSTLDAYGCVMKLLPLFASLDLTLQQRQDALQHGRNLVGNAAKAAIDAHKHEMAVTFLSTGRSIFWSQAYQLRTPVDELKKTHPGLAEKFITESRLVEYASSSRPDRLLNSSNGKQSSADSYKSLHILADQRRQTIEEIRRIPGYERFLLPASYSSLQCAAQSGVIVFLNGSQHGCDALIMPQTGPVEHVPLSDIGFKDLEELAMLVQAILVAKERPNDDCQNASDFFQGMLGRDMTRKDLYQSGQDAFRAALECLWVKVVQPVVKALGVEKIDSPPRIWWCPTGPFASLPIHAAGVYSGNADPIDCVFHYVVSSYCTSPQDLLHDSPRITHDFRMTAVIEPEVLGAQPLPATNEELMKVKKHLPDQQHLITHVGTKNASKEIDDLLSDIQRSSFVHFGCHGMQNLDDPLESYLLLSGGRLTMSRIMQECQVPEGALAYLSACETAKGDGVRPDESLNLVSTMMFAGFRSVVGTLWSILDEDAPIVAEVFYRHLFRNGKEAPPDVRDAAYGLHLATKELRDRGRPFHSWVPYVHYGI